jgi:hypothetical protein
LNARVLLALSLFISATDLCAHVADSTSTLMLTYETSKGTALLCVLVVALVRVGGVLALLFAASQSASLCLAAVATCTFLFFAQEDASAVEVVHALASIVFGLCTCVGLHVSKRSGSFNAHEDVEADADRLLRRVATSAHIGAVRVIVVSSLAFWLLAGSNGVAFVFAVGRFDRACEAEFDAAVASVSASLTRSDAGRHMGAKKRL